LGLVHACRCNTGPFHRANQERDDGVHEAALYLESMSPPQHLSGVILESVDDIPTQTANRESPHGEVCRPSDDAASEPPRQNGKRPYGGTSRPSDDAASESPRQKRKRPYDETSTPSDDAASKSLRRE
jgi:hypothetical protein